MYRIIILFAMLALLVAGVWSFGMAVYLGVQSLKDRREQKHQNIYERRNFDSPLDSVKTAKSLTQTRWQR